MRTFAQKPKAAQQTKSAKSTHPARVLSGQSREVRSILHSQRTIGNQAVQRMMQAKTEETEADSATNASPRFAHDFSRVPLHPTARTTIQPKLTVSTPRDRYEREADRVAEQVMHMPESKLQRSCACGRECPRCRNAGQSSGQMFLQPKPTQVTSSAGAASPPIVDEVLRRTGHPLDASTRNFMEPRFGIDGSSSPALFTRTTRQGIPTADCATLETET